MLVLEAVAVVAGVLVVLAGLRDAFLTILHPDRDGGLSDLLNRGIWRVAVAVARGRRFARHQVLEMAGPLMVVADILLWMLMPIAGFALIVWPFLTSGFDSGSVGASFGDALYYSGTTFTTLGYGDVTPTSGVWEFLAIAEALTGFVLMGVSIAYIVGVFEGVDQRDALALQVYGETGRTWSGSRFLEQVLRDEGPVDLRRRLQSWAGMMRDLHGRLYRFHGLAFYVRTQGLDLGPERMLYTVSEVALRAKALSALPGMEPLRGAAEHLAINLERFASAIVARQALKPVRQAYEDVQPGDVDQARALQACADAARMAGVEAPTACDPSLALLAARLRLFLEQLDALTRWRTLARGPVPAPWSAHPSAAP